MQKATQADSPAIHAGTPRDTNGRQIAPAPETDAVLAMIDRAARDPSVNIEKLRELLAMRKEIVEDGRRQQFDLALGEAQREIIRVVADAENSQTRSRYATYAALDRAIRPIYSRHGFCVSYDTDISPKGDNYLRVLAYVSAFGHTRTYKIDIPVVTKGPRGNDMMTPVHATGSANSYGKRYLLVDIFNVAVVETDDDGNAAGGIEKIGEQQLKDLIQLGREVGANQKQFCAYFKIESLADLPANQFDDAMNMLRAKKNIRNRNDKDAAA